MSDETFNAVMRASLQTRSEAARIVPNEIDPWFWVWSIAFQNHMEDEANRYLAKRGCYKLLPNGATCPGIASEEQACDRCEAGKWVRDHALAALKSATAEGEAG